jgi:hypothetical protein
MSGSIDGAGHGRALSTALSPATWVLVSHSMTATRVFCTSNINVYAMLIPHSMTDATRDCCIVAF